MVLYIILLIIALWITWRIIKIVINVKRMTKVLDQKIKELGGHANMYEPLVYFMRSTYGCHKVEEVGRRLIISNAPLNKNRVFATQTLMLNQSMSSVAVTFTSVPDGISKTWTEPMPIQQVELWNKIMSIAHRDQI